MCHFWKPTQELGLKESSALIFGMVVAFRMFFYGTLWRSSGGTAATDKKPPFAADIFFAIYRWIRHFLIIWDQLNLNKKKDLFVFR